MSRILPIGAVDSQTTELRLQSRINDLEARLSSMENSSKALLMSALPTVPYDGQEIYLQTSAMATAGIIWRLRYMASIVDGMPWEVVGGGDLYGNEIATTESTASTTMTNLATVGPTVTCPLKGIYWVTFGANAFKATVANNSAIIGISNAGAAASDLVNFATSSTVADVAGIARGKQYTIAAAGDTLQMKYRSSAGNPGTVQFSQRWMVATPQRVG